MNQDELKQKVAQAGIPYTSNVDNDTLPDNVGVFLFGAGVNRGVGNAQDNYLLGNSLDNIIDGGQGNDVMAAYAGNDTYCIDSTNINADWSFDFDMGDIVVENVDDGIDTVSASASYILSANIENLVLIGNARGGGGNALNNSITGNAADNIINGGAGVDMAIGGAGNDCYFIDSANINADWSFDFDMGDRVVENVDDGTDTVYASASYILSANIENLVLTGNAIGGGGNALNNSITGNAADNIINGGAGVDMAIGCAGNDWYFIDETNDVTTELGGEGTDLVFSTATNYALNANVEHLILWGTGLNCTGNAGDNNIFGNALNNTLADGAGSDILVGGRGQDTYNLSVDNTIDTLYFNAGDSVVTGYDQANNFNLGSSATSSAGTDRLNLDSTAIATNAIVNGVNAGTIMSHSISNGIISFGNADSFTVPATVIAANVLTDVLAYLQSNIIGGDTVAFIVEGNTFVFQDGGIGVADTVIELLGVQATSLSNTGLAVGSVCIM